jgi:hypothetical protein
LSVAKSTQIRFQSRRSQSGEIFLIDRVDAKNEQELVSSLSGLWLAFFNRHARPAGRHDNPMPELTLSPSQGSMNSAAGDFFLEWLDARR